VGRTASLGVEDQLAALAVAVARSVGPAARTCRAVVVEPALVEDGGLDGRLVARHRPIVSLWPGGSRGGAALAA
jgi:hypothetical protein